MITTVEPLTNIERETSEAQGIMLDLWCGKSPGQRHWRASKNKTWGKMIPLREWPTDRGQIILRGKTWLLLVLNCSIKPPFFFLWCHLNLSPKVTLHTQQGALSLFVSTYCMVSSSPRAPCYLKWNSKTVPFIIWDRHIMFWCHPIQLRDLLLGNEYWHQFADLCDSICWLTQLCHVSHVSSERCMWTGGLAHIQAASQVRVPGGGERMTICGIFQQMASHNNKASFINVSKTQRLLLKCTQFTWHNNCVSLNTNKVDIIHWVCISILEKIVLLECTPSDCTFVCQESLTCPTV